VSTSITRESALALPLILGPAEAAPFVPASVSGFYALIKRGESPIPIVRVGKRMKVRRCDLLAYLGISEDLGRTA
jgi:hypothetical protein